MYSLHVADYSLTVYFVFHFNSQKTLGRLCAIFNFWQEWKRGCEEY